MTETIILASASPRRREILERMQVPFEVCPAADEYAPEGMSPEEHVRALARCKAEQVAHIHPGRLVLGADTMVVLDDRMLGKPKSREQAVEMLMRLQGRSHRVMTGVWVCRAAGNKKMLQADGFTDVADVHFFPMTRQEAVEYVSTGEPMDKAGAYGVQGCGMRYVESIRGDFFCVMGLPAGRVYRFLRNFSEK